MIVGILKERKPEEYRVPLVPEAAGRLVDRGHSVLVETGAGVGAGLPDDAYARAGAVVGESARAVTERAELVLKVKEPVPEEFEAFFPGRCLFCYLHSETRPALVDMLLEKSITAIAFENVRSEDGFAPLLAPMSVIAGQQAVLQGMRFLWSHEGGPGVSMVAYPGLEPPEVVVLGAGEAGLQAARVAAALGARVSLFEIDSTRMRRLRGTLPPNVSLLHPRLVPLEPFLFRADMVVNAATVPPESSTHLIERKTLAAMKRGSVIVDVTANIRGAVETVDRYTTHGDPVWEVDGVVHYAVTNIPGAVASTASRALSMEVLPYATEIADKGATAALRENAALLEGLTALGGTLCWKEAGEFQNRPWRTPRETLGLRGTARGGLP